MDLMQLAAIFLALLTGVGWLNVRFVRLPTSVAMLSAGVVVAALLLGAQTVIGPFWGFNHVRSVVARLDFSRTVLNYLLAFLVFASGLQADLTKLRRLRLQVWTLATLGVAVSTALVGFGLWGTAGWLGLGLPLAWALTFGALISATDPISVFSALRSGAVSPLLGSVLQGEALFNDGVGIVAYTAMLDFAVTGAAPRLGPTLLEVAIAAGGGLALGVFVAHATGFLLRRIDDYVVETTGTIALAVGVYVLAGMLHVSGPIAAAAAGLVVSQAPRRGGMSAQTRRYVDGFWDLVDQILNALLFLLLGLQVFVLPFSLGEIWLWAAAVTLAIVSRLIVVLPWGVFFHLHDAERGASFVLTWGGLRGAVSLALALALPHTPYRDLLLTTTFVVVTFSIVVQGLTFPPLARWMRGSTSPAPASVEPG